MRLIDIHTHTPQEGTFGILNSNEATQHPFSTGIHPWDIVADWEERMNKIEDIAQDKNCVAIGECGIDRLKSTATYETQRTILARHAKLAENLGKPLIIHLVKGEEEILRFAKEHSHREAWIIHGFRGKPQQARNLIRAGYYLSFGEKFNSDTLRSVPMEKIFIESDESHTPLQKIYDNIAATLGISNEKLLEQITANAQQCGIKP